MGWISADDNSCYIGTSHRATDAENAERAIELDARWKAAEERKTAFNLVGQVVRVGEWYLAFEIVVKRSIAYDTITEQPYLSVKIGGIQRIYSDVDILICANQVVKGGDEYSSDPVDRAYMNSINSSIGAVGQVFRFADDLVGEPWLFERDFTKRIVARYGDNGRRGKRK